MNTALIRDFLLWCAVINYGVLLGWFAAFTLAHDAMFRLHHHWFAVSREQFDAIHDVGAVPNKLTVEISPAARFGDSLRRFQNEAGNGAGVLTALVINQPWMLNHLQQ